MEKTTAIHSKMAGARCGNDFLAMATVRLNPHPWKAPLILETRVVPPSPRSKAVGNWSASADTAPDFPRISDALASNTATSSSTRVWPVTSIGSKASWANSSFHGATRTHLSSWRRLPMNSNPVLNPEQSPCPLLKLVRRRLIPTIQPHPRHGSHHHFQMAQTCLQCRGTQSCPPRRQPQWTLLPLCRHRPIPPPLPNLNQKRNPAFWNA